MLRRAELSDRVGTTRFSVEVPGGYSTCAAHAPTPPLSLSGSKIESSFVGEYAGDVAYLMENMPKVEDSVAPAAAEEGEAAAAAADSAYLCEPFVDELFTR